MSETLQPGFIPAKVGDYAAFQRKKEGLWVFGQVTQVTKNPPRVRKLIDNRGVDHQVGPHDHIRLAPAQKLNGLGMEQTWKDSPPTFETWEEVRAIVVPHVKEIVDGTAS